MFTGLGWGKGQYRTVIKYGSSHSFEVKLEFLVSEYPQQLQQQTFSGSDDCDFWLSDIPMNFYSDENNTSKDLSKYHWQWGL